MNGEQDGVDACYINHLVKYSVLVTKKMNVSITCFSEREVIFGIVHPQYRVIVGAGYATLGRGALVQRAVLCLPAQRERKRREKLYTSDTQRERVQLHLVCYLSGEQCNGKGLGTGFLLLGTHAKKTLKSKLNIHLTFSIRIAY